MNNLSKVIFGTLLGAGVAAGISKLAEQSIEPPYDPLDLAASPPRESLKERWARAQVEGEAARLAKEEELRAYFRVKVNDQQAMRDTPTI